MTEPHILGDKQCPRCRKLAVIWICTHSATTRKRPLKIVEHGYFECTECGWRSEPITTTIEAEQ